MLTFISKMLEITVGECLNKCMVHANDAIFYILKNIFIKIGNFLWVIMKISGEEFVK